MPRARRPRRCDVSWWWRAAAGEPGGARDGLPHALDQLRTCFEPAHHVALKAGSENPLEQVEVLVLASVHVANHGIDVLLLLRQGVLPGMRYPAAGGGV